MSSRTKPDMMIWPAKVAVIVDAWPAASSPTAQMSRPEPPKALLERGPRLREPDRRAHRLVRRVRALVGGAVVRVARPVVVVDRARRHARVAVGRARAE